ncbi:MAG: HlyD family type I secretion periplasmic adaptor subunit [Pseudomonadota bacterium]
MGDKNLSRHERDFLPAALEIQETPPSPAGRFLGWSLMILFTLCLLWACFGKVDIVAVAEGKIIPSGHTKIIQPVEKGVVKAIYVKEGQAVAQGEALIELDQTLTAADQARLTQELAFVEDNLVRQQAMLKMLEHSDQPLSYPHVMQQLGTANPQSTEQAQRLWQQWRSYQSRRNALAAQWEEKQAEQRTSQEIIRQLEGTLPLITKRVTTLKTLADKNMAPEMDYLALEEERIEQQQTLAAEQARQQQFAAALHSIKQQIQALDAETHGQTLTDLQEQQRQREVIHQELNKAKDINAKQILYAPVAGQVQQLMVNTIGGVVTPAQELMIIVPKEQQLEIEAVLENKDIGFVREGQTAEVKIHTFPFTRYGVIDAEVTGITQDAIADEQRGLIYKMRLKLGKSTLWVDEKEISLIPGMLVSAEVKTGKRRLIEYFLAPLIQYGDESVRER